MDIGKIFKDTWDIYSKNFVEILIAGLIAIVLSVITLGILAPAMMTGLSLIFVKAKRGQAVANKEVFACLGKWYVYLGACIVIGILVCLGLICLIIPGLILMTWWMYALLFMADKNLSISAAMKASKDLVRSKNLWMHLLFLVIYSFIAQLGNYIFYIGAFLTWPFALGLLGAAYADEAQ